MPKAWNDKGKSNNQQHFSSLCRYSHVEGFASVILSNVLFLPKVAWGIKPWGSYQDHEGKKEVRRIQVRKVNKDPYFSKVQNYIIALKRHIILYCLHNKDDSVINNFSFSILVIIKTFLFQMIQNSREIYQLVLPLISMAIGLSRQ